MLDIQPATFTKDGKTYSLELGRIERTMLGYEDHGIFTFMLSLDYGGSAQGAGGYGLDEYDKPTEDRIGTAYGLDLIIRILRVVGVDEWEQVKGKHIHAIRAESYGPIVGLANHMKPSTNFLFFSEHADRWFPDRAKKSS